MAARFFTFLILTLAQITCLPATLSAQAPTGNSLLWRVSGNGLQEPSFLYGTIHLICPQDLRIDATVNDAVASVEELALELDLDDMTTMLRVQVGLMAPNGPKPSEYLDAETYNLVSSFFKDSLGQSLEALPMKPFGLASMVSQGYLGCSQPVAVDMELMRLAKENELEVTGLETAEEQLAAIDTIPFEQQVRMLVESVTQFDSMRMVFDDLTATYRAQDLGRLQTMMDSYLNNGYEEFGNSLLTQRNVNWIPLMEARMQKRPVLFGVGAGHLGGENGLIALLRIKGYRVEAIR